MKIDQVSTLSGRGAGLLAKMLEIAPLFQFAEFRKDSSTSITIPDKSAFTGTSARAVGADLVKDLQQPNPSLVKLALYGREVGIDDVYKADFSVTGSHVLLQRQADRALSAMAIKLAQEVESQMFNGLNASNQMLGIANFVKDAAAGGQSEALGFTTAELASMNRQVSLQLNTVANQDIFVELLYEELANVPGANVIICNTKLAARLTTIAKRLGAAGETVNTFGIPITTFNNVPILPLNTAVISQAESDGTNNDCTSLHIARFAEELGVCFNTNEGFKFQDFQDYQKSPQGVARLQFFLNLIVERTDALRRLSRIRL
jgi:hypothetical protein